MTVHTRSAPSTSFTLDYGMNSEFRYKNNPTTDTTTVSITHEGRNAIEVTFDGDTTTVATRFPRNPDYLSNIRISRMPHRIVYTIEDGRVVSEIHHETDDKNSPVRATYTFDADGTRHGDRPGKEVELPGGRRGYFDSSDYNSTITAKK